MEVKPNDYVRIFVDVDREVLAKCRKKLEYLGIGDSWFVGACMQDYVKGHFRIIDGEVEDTRKLR